MPCLSHSDSCSLLHCTIKEIITDQIASVYSVSHCMRGLRWIQGFPCDGYFGACITFPIEKPHHASCFEASTVYICLTCLQYKVNPCYYVQPCRAHDFYASGCRLNISVVPFEQGEVFNPSNPTPPCPTVAPGFLYFVRKSNILVYFSALIRQCSSLRPSCPSLWDKETSKSLSS